MAHNGIWPARDELVCFLLGGARTPVAADVETGPNRDGDADGRETCADPQQGPRGHEQGQAVGGEMRAGPMMAVRPGHHDDDDHQDKLSHVVGSGGSPPAHVAFDEKRQTEPYKQKHCPTREDDTVRSHRALRPRYGRGHRSPCCAGRWACHSGGSFLATTRRCALHPIIDGSRSHTRATRSRSSRPWSSFHRCMKSGSIQPGPSTPYRASTVRPTAPTSSRRSSGLWKYAVVKYSRRSVGFRCCPSTRSRSTMRANVGSLSTLRLRPSSVDAQREMPAAMSTPLARSTRTASSSARRRSSASTRWYSGPRSSTRSAELSGS